MIVDDLGIAVANGAYTPHRSSQKRRQGVNEAAHRARRRWCGREERSTSTPTVRVHRTARPDVEPTAPTLATGYDLAFDENALAMPGVAMRTDRADLGAFFDPHPSTHQEIPMRQLSSTLSRALASAVVTAAALSGPAMAATCAGAKCGPKPMAAKGGCKASAHKVKAKAKTAGKCAAKCAPKCGAMAGKSATCAGKK